MNKMTRDAIKTITEGTLKRISGPSFAGGAAELTFWLLLSIMPATILLAQLLQLFTITMDAVNNVLGMYFTEEVYHLFSPLIQYNPRGGVTIFLVLMALWAGSSAVFTLMRITNQAYGVIPAAEDQIVIVITERLRAILMTLLILLTFIFTFYVVIFGELIVNMVLSYNSVFLGREYTFSDVWLAVRWLIAFGLFFLMTFSIYTILPRSVSGKKKPVSSNKRTNFKRALRHWTKKYRLESKRALPGSLFSAVAMLIATWIYTLLFRNIDLTNFNILYGGLSSVVVLLFWFYIISFIVIIGIQINATSAEYWRSNEKRNNNE
jgi:membrane protein